MVKGAQSDGWHEHVTAYLKRYGIMNYRAADRCNVHDALILGCHQLDMGMVSHALKEGGRCDYISELHLEPSVPINPVHALGALLNGMHQLEMHKGLRPEEKHEKRKMAVEIFRKLNCQSPKMLLGTRFLQIDHTLILPIDLFAKIFFESKADKAYDEIFQGLLVHKPHISEHALGQLKSAALKFGRPDLLPEITHAAYRSNQHYAWPALSAYYDPDVHDVDVLYTTKQKLLQKPKNSLKDYPDKTLLYSKSGGAPRKMYITAAGKIIDKESLYNRQNTDDTPVKVYGTSAQIQKLRKKLI